MIYIAHNAVKAALVDPTTKKPIEDKAAKLEVHRLLSYTVPGHEHMQAFKSGTWSGKSSFFDFETCSFPAGFVDLVTRGLRKIGKQVQVVAKPLPEPLGPALPKVDEFGYVGRYDYQPQVMEAVVRHGRGIAQIATGGGKSRTARMVYRRIDRPTLFLTTRAVLAYQMKEAVEGMGEQVAMLGDGHWGIPYKKPGGGMGVRTTKFTVAMVQTLIERLEIKTVVGELQALNDRRDTADNKKIEELRRKLHAQKVPVVQIGQRVTELVEQLQAARPTRQHDIDMLTVKVEHHMRLRQQTMEILATFELVIGEEAHEVSGTGFYDVMAACVNAQYRLALTATPFMKPDEEANMRLLATFGPVLVRVTEKMLIDRGILAKPYFKFLKLAAPPKGLFRSTAFATAYVRGIVENELRNKMFCAEVLRGLRYGLNALMLVQRKDHGQILKAMLERAGVRVEFIFGENNQTERQEKLDALAAGRLDVLIGSTILDVGVDVPSLGMVCLVGGGKAEVALRQRIGRGLREKKNGLPNIALIVDAYDEHNNSLRDHSGQRQAIIKATPGFAENIVRDFDFQALGLERKAA